VFDIVGETDWQALAAADPEPPDYGSREPVEYPPSMVDEPWSKRAPSSDPEPPDYHSWESVEHSPGLVDERWSERVPSGLLMDTLTAVTHEPLTPDQSLEAIAGWERLIAFAQAAQLREMARFGRLRPGCEPGSGDDFAADEIAVELQWTRMAANDRLTLARVLTDRLPATLAALSRGELDLRKADAVADATWTLTAGQAQQVQDRVLARAATRDVSTISWWRATLRREVMKADPDGATARHEQAKTERQVVFTPAADGMATLWAVLTATDARSIYTLLDTHARRAATPDDQRTMDQRRADTLVDLLIGTTAPTGRVRVQVNVTVAASTLAGLDEQPGNLAGLDEQPGNLAGYGPITAKAARDLAGGDATWRRILTDPPTGGAALLDYGRTTYHPPKALADHIRARDRHCVFPGCRQPATHCDLDHTRPFPHGPTNHTNLGPLCRHHHIAKTHGGWTVNQPEPGTFDWTSPTGRHYQVTPEPAL
jgi:hypothetical protein